MDMEFVQALLLQASCLSLSFCSRYGETCKSFILLVSCALDLPTHTDFRLRKTGKATRNDTGLLEFKVWESLKGENDKNTQGVHMA